MRLFPSLAGMLPVANKFAVYAVKGYRRRSRRNNFARRSIALDAGGLRAAISEGDNDVRIDSSS